LIAAKLLDVNPENDCFEDSVAGVQAANIGKMTSIGMEELFYKYIFKFYPNRKEFIED
jgi:beta-phosphoglucomutase